MGIFMEIWKKISNIPQYSVSSLGRIRNDSSGKILRNKISATRKDRLGNETYYYAVCLKSQYYYVHRLVAFEFLPQIEGKTEVNHKDRNKINNTVDNLEWVSPSENIAHSYNNGRYSNPSTFLKLGYLGESHPNSILTVEKVKKIRERYLSGERQNRLAKDFSVSKQTICFIVNNVTWKNV